MKNPIFVQKINLQYAYVIKSTHTHKTNIPSHYLQSKWIFDKIWIFGIVCKRGRPEQVLKARLEIKLTSKEAESSALTPARG